MRHIPAAVAMICLISAGCGQRAAAPAPARGTEAAHSAPLLVLGNPPQIKANDGGDLADARAIADRADADTLAQRSDAARVAPDALPYLTGSAPGRAFLALASPRALARGAPADRCPGTGVAAGATRGQAAVAALGQCLAANGADHPGCGCQVVALDRLVTVPRAEVAYATGTAARLRGPGLDTLLVAEDDPGGATLLRGLTGPVARLTRGADEAVTLSFLDGRGTWRGRSLKVGFRRGRLAERIYATDDRGRRLSLLIGFAPDELAAQAGAWLAWPGGG